MGYTPGCWRCSIKWRLAPVAPLVIFMGVGAMTDFGPLLAKPAHPAARRGGAVRHLRHCAGGADAELLRPDFFTLPQAAAIGIIGGADGLTAIYLSGKLAPSCWGHRGGGVLCAALVPLIQLPIMRALTSARKSAKSALCSCAR